MKRQDTVAPVRGVARLGRAGRRCARAAVAVAAVGLPVLVLGLRLLGFQMVTVLGGSMEPTIATGSLALARPVEPGSVRVGDVIIFQTEGAAQGSRTPPTMHRVIALDTTGAYPVATTQGDANPSPDPYPVALRGPTPRVALALPLLGYLYVYLRALGPWLALAAVGVYAGLRLMGRGRVGQPASQDTS